MTGRPSDVLEKIGNFVVKKGRALLRSRAPRQKFDGVEDPYDGCSETTDLEWEILRFNGRCYFYPMRDCPGWIAGTKCGRMGDRIPRNANQENNESWKDFLDRWKRESWLWKRPFLRTGWLYAIGSFTGTPGHGDLARMMSRFSRKFSGH